MLQDDDRWNWFFQPIEIKGKGRFLIIIKKEDELERHKWRKYNSVRIPNNTMILAMTQADDAPFSTK